MQAKTKFKWTLFLGAIAFESLSVLLEQRFSTNSVVGVFAFDFVAIGLVFLGFMMGKQDNIGVAPRNDVTSNQHETPKYSGAPFSFW